MWDVKPLLGSVLLYFLPFRKCKSPRSSLVQRSHNKKDTLRRNLIKITTPMQPPPGENLGGGFVNTYIRKTGMTKARSFLREKRI